MGLPTILVLIFFPLWNCCDAGSLEWKRGVRRVTMGRQFAQKLDGHGPYHWPLVVVCAPPLISQIWSLHQYVMFLLGWILLALHDVLVSTSLLTASCGLNPVVFFIHFHGFDVLKFSYIFLSLAVSRHWLSGLCNPRHLLLFIVSRAPFYWHGLTLIPAWISNYNHYRMWDETALPLKFGNVFSSHTLQGMSLLIRNGIKVDPC